MTAEMKTGNPLLFAAGCSILKTKGVVPMDLRMNNDYVIVDSIHAGDDEYVLGVNANVPDHFATWKCDKASYYYWGHYFNDLLKAQKDLAERTLEALRSFEEQQQDIAAPKQSPWGEVQHCKKLTNGVFEVDTAGHGGIMAHTDMAFRLFSIPAIKCSFHFDSYQCFEEDCDAQVAIRELMDKGIVAPTVNEYFHEGEYEHCINESIKRFHPDYWKERADRLHLPECKSPDSHNTDEPER